MRSFLAILLLIGAQWVSPPALAQQTAPQSQPAATQESAAEAASPPKPLPAPPQPKSLDQ